MVIADRFPFASTVKDIWPSLVALLVLDVAVTIGYVGLGWTWLTPEEVPLALLGSGIAVFLGIRNNAAYARWWESRKLWGQVVNDSRSFTRSLNVLMLPPEASEMRRRLTLYQVAWVHALRHFLRKQTPSDVRPFLPDDAVERVMTSSNPPFAVQREIGDGLAEARRRGWCDTIEVQSLNLLLTNLTDSQGGLERIRNTPLPQQYRYFTRLFVAAYCMFLPFGIVPDFNIVTPLVSGAIGFAFLAMDQSGRHLEDPFEDIIHDTPMTALSRTIERNLRESIGEKDLPPKLEPADGVLR